MSNNDRRLFDYPVYLRGLTQNRWGGYRTQRIRVFRGSTFGAASKCRTYSEAEKKSLELKLKSEGRL